MRMRADAPVLWRAQGESQIGAEPGRSLLLRGLSPGEQELLDHLPRRLGDASLLRAARRCSVNVERARALLGELRDQGALRSEESRPSNDDETYWEHLLASPRRRSCALRRSIVALLGCDPLTRGLGLLLAEAGVGTVLTDDDALAAQLESHACEVRTRSPLETKPHLAVTSDAHVMDPVQARCLAQAGVAHLSLTVREVSVRIGPVFTHDSPVCHVCVDLWERDADPLWPVVATQARLCAPPAVESILLHHARAVTARAVVESLVDAPRRWRGRAVELSAEDAQGVTRVWDPHPQCLCTQA